MPIYQMVLNFSFFQDELRKQFKEKRSKPTTRANGKKRLESQSFVLIKKKKK